MIGTDQEPSRKVLDALNGVFGDGQYQIAYEQEATGVKGIVRTRENPSREYTTRFSPGLVPEQVEAVWLELVARASVQHRAAFAATVPAPGGVPPPEHEPVVGPDDPIDNPTGDETREPVPEGVWPAAVERRGD